MQKKFIDHEDYDHLINTLSGDFRSLINRMKRIEDNVKLTIGGINKKDLADKSEDWINPIGGNKWTIHYGHIRIGKKTITHFYPYTEFTATNKEKAFLVLSKEEEYKISSNSLTSLGSKFGKNTEHDFGAFLLKNYWVINIFRGHFFKSFRETVQNSDFTPYQIIYEFASNRKYRLIESFVQKEKWFMYLHRWGVALIKEHQNYLLFETYISCAELKDDQINAIIEHLKQLDENDYFATAFYLMEGPQWRILLDINRLTAFVDNLKKMNLELGNKLEAEITGYWKKYLL